MTQTISQDKVVGIHYTVKTANGDILDQSREGQPLQFIFGRGMLIKGLENALAGRIVSDKFVAEVAAKDAYGERRESLVQAVPRSLFGSNDVAPGMQFRATTDHGEQSVIIVDVGDDEVVVDGNHPLAGTDLTFDVEVVEVRDATPSEIDHGHVHPHGDHHDH